MATGPTYKVKFRRRREGRTDYSARLSLLISKKKRLVVRRSANNFVAQIAMFDLKGDKIIASADSVELKKYGWTIHGGNTPSAYLVGYLCGKKAIANGVKDAVLDLGLQNSVPRSSLFAVLKGVIDAGVSIPHDAKSVPSEDRILGRHIAGAKKGKSKSQFSSYSKNGINPEKIPEMVKELKSKIEFIGGKK